MGDDHRTAVAQLTALVTSVFGTVTGVEAIAPGTAFGQVGGTSLRGVRVLAALADETGVLLDLGTLTLDTTPAELAEALAGAGARRA